MSVLGNLKFSVATPNSSKEQYFKVFNGFDRPTTLVDLFVNQDDDGVVKLQAGSTRSLVCNYFSIVKCPSLPLEIAPQSFLRLGVVYCPTSVGKHSAVVQLMLREPGLEKPRLSRQTVSLLGECKPRLNGSQKIDKKSVVDDESDDGGATTVANKKAKNQQQSNAVVAGVNNNSNATKKTATFNDDDNDNDNNNDANVDENNNDDSDEATLVKRLFNTPLKPTEKRSPIRSIRSIARTRTTGNNQSARRVTLLDDQETDACLRRIEARLMTIEDRLKILIDQRAPPAAQTSSRVGNEILLSSSASRAHYATNSNTIVDNYPFDDTLNDDDDDGRNDNDAPSSARIVPSKGNPQQQHQQQQQNASFLHDNDALRLDDLDAKSPRLRTPPPTTASWQRYMNSVTEPFSPSLERLVDQYQLNQLQTPLTSKTVRRTATTEQ